MSTKKRSIYLLLFIAVWIFAAGCATQNPEQNLNPPGFWKGLLHGFIILFSFIASLFTDYRIYAFPNAGGWYDFGFLFGAMIFFGGGGASSKR
ncbi:hypothetical protein SAMN05444274_105126 [Mariniphaga anaerophila]|uniref:Lipoprotein n=1 Tax=Mariniphaga anaerophila TaxID=1484053 RepID=A0A1M5BFH7_9BACT|nr:hypothetical protein [Mariniphaga anaerophila]SHF41264.1 hypothetical protein SAMN05444274_105126 [Mariniphaga anaerophila]